MTGGSTGIGAATVEILSKAGAKVVLGDTNKDAGEQLSKEHSAITFVQCDVTSYTDLYKLFKTAYDQHGRVDHAISCAGIFGEHPLHTNGRKCLTVHQSLATGSIRD